MMISENQWYCGKVRWFDDLSGEGVIEANGNRLFFHYSAIISRKKWKTIEDNAFVKFKVVADVTFIQPKLVKKLTKKEIKQLSPLLYLRSAHRRSK